MNPAIQAILYTAATGKTSIVISRDDSVRRYHASQAQQLAQMSGVPVKFRVPASLVIEGGGEVVFLTVNKCNTAHEGKVFVDPFAMIGLTPEQAMALKKTGQGDPQPSRV
jgi:thioredoxin reductase